MWAILVRRMQPPSARGMLAALVKGLGPIPVRGIGNAFRQGNPEPHPGRLHIPSRLGIHIRTRTGTRARIPTGTRVKSYPKRLDPSGTGPLITGLYEENPKNESCVPVFSSVWRCWRL